MSLTNDIAGDRPAALVIEGPAGFDPTAASGEGDSSARRLITVFKVAGVSRVVIAGGDLSLIEKHCPRKGADFLTLPKKSALTGAAGCVVTGLAYLKGKNERALIVPADFSLFEPETVRRLCASDADIAVPVCDGRRGWPLCVAASCFDELIALGGDPEAFLSENRARVLEVETADAGIFARRGAGGVPKQAPPIAIRPVMKVSIAREHGFFGPGTLQLVKLVDDTKSLNRASKLMGMAYTRAFKMKKEMEKQLGFKVFESRAGGPGRYTELTPECKRFVEKYTAFSNECEDCAQDAFERHFGSAAPKRGGSST